MLKLIHYGWVILFTSLKATHIVACKDATESENLALSWLYSFTTQPNFVHE